MIARPRARVAPWAALTVAAAAASCGGARRADPPSPRPSAAETVTFNRDVAPIVFQNCVPCHRPGEAGPFSLLTYADVHKRAPQIARVTSMRYMPPWPPAPGYGDLAGARHLSDEQIALIQRWAAQGAPAGPPSSNT